MKTSRIQMQAAAVIAALTVFACGGGGGGARPTGYSKGVIASNSGKAIVVNGTSFSTVGSSISIDRSAGTSTDLHVGRIVKARGSVNDDGVTKSGMEIEFDDNLEGMITAITGTASVTVFGQTIEVDANTVFNGTSGLGGATPLAVGNVIEVSAFPTGSGTFLATYIEKKTGVTVFEIKGVVSNYAGGSTFTLTPPGSSVPINVTFGAGVAMPSGFGNGKLVEVWTTDVNAGTSITATRVELENELEPSENEGTEVEGKITSFTSLSNFVVNGMTVNAGSATIAGGTAANIAVNAKVEAEGSFSGGVLKASRVVLKSTW